MYGILEADGGLVGLAAERGAQPLVPSDLLLLTNFVAAHDSFRLVRVLSPKPYPNPLADALHEHTWHPVSACLNRSRTRACNMLQRSILAWVTVVAVMSAAYLPD